MLLKVAKHSFKVSMPNSPFFFNYLCLGTGFLQGQPQKGKVCFDTMATGLVELCLFEKSPVIRIAHYEFT